MNSESKSEEDGEMDFQGIVCKYLLGYLHEKTEKLSQTVFDTYSKVYDDSIRELLPKYPNLEETHIYYFLDTPSVEESINSYFETPDQKILFNKLVKEFTNCFDVDHFSRNEVEEIITDLFQILENNIRKNPDLKSNLVLQILKESQIHLKSLLTVDELFSRYLESTNLLNHKYHFVGRSEILSQLDSFIESDKKIALLPGRGGIGKSRILFEFGNNFESKHNEWELRYTSENPLTSDSIRELPERKCVIVVDDAHRREDIITLLETSQQAKILIKSPIKIILAFRPHGLNYIKNSCNRCGFGNRETEEILEVQGLKRKEKEELGKRILGIKHYQYLDTLIQVAKESTIVLVIGARLIEENKVHPALLEQDREFQDAIFSRFQEDILKGFIDDLDAKLCKKILSTISILSPIQKEKEFIQKASEYLKVDKSEFNRALDTLERCRVLHRVGSKLRITPDVLSDHILHNSCITLDGNSNEYPQEIFDIFGDIYFENILNNLAELDWRVTKQKGKTDLLVEIWDNIEEKFKNSSNSDRVVLLENFEKVACFQPSRTLRLIRYAINNPINKSERDFTPLYEFTHEDVLGKIPMLLKNVSYNIEYFRQSCELLWDLAKKEIEIKHGSIGSNHALTVFVDLAKYQMYKSFEYSSQILTFVEKEINNHIDSKCTCSLLDILDPILEKEIIFDKFIGVEINFIPYPIPYENTKEIRRKAILLIGDQLKSKSIKVTLRALKSLSEALNPPTGFFGREVSTDEIETWLPEQMKILNIIENTSKITTDPIIKIQIKSSLAWHARQTNQPEVADKASLIIKSLPEDFDTKFMRAIWYHYDRDYEDFEENQEELFQEMGEVVKEFLDKCNNEGKKIFDYLNETITKFEINKILIHPLDFLILLGTINHEIAVEVCNQIIYNTSKPLASYLNSLLSGIREKDENTAIRLIQIAVDIGDPILCRSIAEGYAYRGWAFKLKNEEIKIITQLISSRDIDTRRLAVDSLGHFPNNLKNEAFKLALSVEIGDDEKLADTYCSIFEKHGISPENLDTEQLKLILKKISKIKVFDGNLYHLKIFLKYCSTKIPEELVDFLLERVDFARKIKYSSADRYQPLPYKGFLNNGLNGISLSPHYKEILQKIRDQSLSPSARYSSWLPSLYLYISDNYSLDSLEVLSEWVNSKDENKIIAVGFLVKKAPLDFVFLHPDFISNLLINAQAISDDCYREVRYDLSKSAFHGAKTGFVGQPSYEDERIRDRAQEFMEMYESGSPIWVFYNWLSEEANRSIKDWLDRDEEMIED